MEMKNQVRWNHNPKLRKFSKKKDRKPNKKNNKNSNNSNCTNEGSTMGYAFLSFNRLLLTS